MSISRCPFGSTSAAQERPSIWRWRDQSLQRMPETRQPARISPRLGLPLRVVSRNVLPARPCPAYNNTELAPRRLTHDFRQLGFYFLTLVRFCVYRACPTLRAGHVDRARPSTSRPPSVTGADVTARHQNGAVHTTESLCPMIQSAALDNGLPVEFFVRLIWQESRLRPNGVGPLTRSGGRAQGIAQFMPSTAAGTPSAGSFRPRPGAAEIGRVPTSAARSIWQSRAGGGRL